MLQHNTSSPHQLVPYCQPLQDFQYQQNHSTVENQTNLHAQMQYLYQKQQESQQQYNQLGQNIQSLFQSNFNQFGNRFFDHQQSVLHNQQQQYLLMQQEYLKSQMSSYTQQQQQIQQQLQQQYDNHGNKLLEYQQQNNQQLAQNLQTQNTQFQSQQAQYTQQINAQYQLELQGFKQFLEQLLQNNADTLFAKFQTYYQQTYSSLQTQLEEVSRELTLTNTNELNTIKLLQTQQKSFSQILDNLCNIQRYIQQDLTLLCKTQNDLYTSSIEGNSSNNQQQCDILNLCFKEVYSKLEQISSNKIDTVLQDGTKVTSYMHSLKGQMKDIQRCIVATVDSIVLQQFNKFETYFNKKVDDISAILTVQDRKITSQQLQQAIPKRPSTQSITKQNSQNSPNFINQGLYQQPQSLYMPITSQYSSSSQQVATGLGQQPQFLSQFPYQPTSIVPSITTLPSQTMSQQSPMLFQPQQLPPYQVQQFVPPPAPPPNLPYMSQSMYSIPQQHNISGPSTQQQQQYGQSICSDIRCQNPSCNTLTSKHSNILSYNGSTPLNYWLRRVDREIQSHGYNDHQGFLLAQSKLSGDALFWLDSNESKFLTYQHPTNSSLNKYSYQLLKPLLATKFTKSFEEYFEDLDKIRQGSGQTYKQFMRKLQKESQHGSISMRYLKQIFVRNIQNRNVALHLTPFINDDNLDLQQLAHKAIYIDKEVNRSRSLYRSSRQYRNVSASSRGSGQSFRSRSSSRPSFRSQSSNSYTLPSRSASPQSRASSGSGTSSRYNPKFKRYKSPSDRYKSSSERYKSPSDRSKYKDKPQHNERPTQRVSLSSATSLSRSKQQVLQKTPSQEQLIQSSQILPSPAQPQQQSNMVQSNKSNSTANKDVTNFSVRETLNNLKLQISLPTLLQNSKCHLQSFYDFVSDIEKPQTQPVTSLIGNQQVSHVSSGQKTRITAQRVDIMKCLNVLVKNQKVQAVLDGGSQPSLINISLCKQLGYTQFKSCDTNYSMVDQSTFTPLGILSTPVQLSDTLEVMLDLVVVKECGFQLLLGLDFITCTQMIQYPTKVQVKNPSTKRYLDLPLVESHFDIASTNCVTATITNDKLDLCSLFITLFLYFLFFLFVLTPKRFCNILHLFLKFFSLILTLIYNLFKQFSPPFILRFTLLMHRFYLFIFKFLYQLIFYLLFLLFFLFVFPCTIAAYFLQNMPYSTCSSQLTFSLTRFKQRKHREHRPITAKKIRVPKRDRNSQNMQHILFPKFPRATYNLILCDAPWQYEQVNALTPSYRTLSFSQLKHLPVSQIAASDCIFLYWTTGPMLHKSLKLCQSYGFKHLTVLHTWRKLSDNKPYKSRTNVASLTQPSVEFLIAAYKGNYKKLLNKSVPYIPQDFPHQVLRHSCKPQKIYSSIAKIFDVYKFPCIELFARCESHPFLDLYGDQIQSYFQPSQKVLKSRTHFSKTQGCVLSVQKPSQQPQAYVQQLLKYFKTSIHQQLTTLLKDTPFKDDQLLQCMKLLTQYLHIFAWTSHEVGCMSNIKHSIQLLPNAQPKAFVPYRLSQVDRQFVETEIQELLRLGYIVRAVSPWAAPIIVVPKEGGKRMVIDFRYLNSQTVKEHWPLPNFSDFLLYLSNAKYISKIDLKSGFFNQQYASAKDQDLTSFVCHLGQFKTTRLWFGLCNAPSSFQRAIMDALGSLIFKCVLVYIDDILIFSSTFEQHIQDLTNVFKSLEKANVKLHPTKCSLFNTKADFLGHTISNGTITPKLKRFSLLSDMSPPKTKTQIKCFLGLISYYRRFIQNFSSIAKPLTDLLQKDIPFTWTSQQQTAFDSLRQSLLKLPSLHLPIDNRTFVLNTDFSSKGIGAVLQQQDSSGSLFPIEFISRTLNKYEQRYGSYEGETLAVIFALSKFRHFLMGQHFVLQTDNHALQQVLKNKSNSPKIHRWLLQLSDFNFTVIHKKGSENTHADALSRLAPLQNTNQQVSFVSHRRNRIYFNLRPFIRFYNPRVFPNVHKIFLKQQKQLFTSPHTTQSILQKQVILSVQQPSQNVDPYSPIDLPDVPCVACNSIDNASEMYICEYCGNGFHSFCFPPCPIVVPSEFYYCNDCISKIQKLNKKDPILDFQLLQFLKTKKFPNTMPETQRKRIQDICKKFSYKDKTFFIYTKGQLRILPTLLARQQLLFEFHDNTSHPGVHKTLSLIMHKYFWPSIRRDVRKHIKSCSLCICKRAEYRDSESLQPLPKGNRPFQYWHVDLLTDLPPTKEDFKHILICICSFSKWVELVPLKNRSALEIAHGFYRDIVCRYGPPITVVSDNGGEFLGEFSTLLQYINCYQKYINPNRPRSNGQAERFVQTVTHLLRNTLHSNNIALNNWVISLPTVLYTLRMSNSVHPICPFQIVYGFIPNLVSPLNETKEAVQPDPSANELQKYTSLLASFQQHAFQNTEKRLQKQFNKGNYYYKQKSTKFPYSFKVNDLVFKSAGRTAKLQLKSEGPFLITQFKNPTTVVLLDMKNNTHIQSSIYNLVPIPVLTNQDSIQYDPQPFDIHKRDTTLHKHTKPRKNARVNRKNHT